MSLYNRFIKLIHLAGDLLLINGVFFLLLNQEVGSVFSYLTNNQVTYIVVFNLCWLVCTYLMDSYEIPRVIRFRKLAGRLFSLVMTHVIFMSIFFFISRYFSYYYSVELILLPYLYIGLLILLFRFVVATALKIYRLKGYNYKRVVIIGGDEIGKDLEYFFGSNPQHGFRLLEVFNGDYQMVDAEHIEEKLDEIRKFCFQNRVDEIYCSVPAVDNLFINRLVDFADNNLIRLKFLPDFRGFYSKNVEIRFYGTVPVLSTLSTPLDGTVNRVIKRLFDIVFSLVVILLVFSWLFPIVAILIKLESKGPVFFKQIRSGILCDDFYIYKFRSMAVNKDADSLQASKNDRRITKVGAFIRKTSVDELPQFFNVLLGNMSVVGPRPHMVKHTEEYSKIIDKYMLRHYVKPGITGLAQVSGFRGETSEDFQMKNRVRLDTLYIKKWSLLIDIKIIVLTVYNALKGEEQAF
jgi:Undecaprenyl-phosphate glucose phosphotransferase